MKSSNIYLFFSCCYYFIREPVCCYLVSVLLSEEDLKIAKGSPFWPCLSLSIVWCRFRRRSLRNHSSTNQTQEKNNEGNKKKKNLEEGGNLERSTSFVTYFLLEIRWVKSSNEIQNFFFSRVVLLFVWSSQEKIIFEFAMEHWRSVIVLFAVAVVLATAQMNMFCGEYNDFSELCNHRVGQNSDVFVDLNWRVVWLDSIKSSDCVC